MRYNNYHKHDHTTNPWFSDTVAKEEDYCKRAVELGHTNVFTTNHGVQGKIFEWLECEKKYGLKMVYGTEGYYVPNRFEKDPSNKHIILMAKNNDGVMQINEIMSEAHSTGFYKRPRIDYELLMRLDPRDVIITTACIAGIWDDTELVVTLHNKFGDNFFLEIQDHNIEKQKEVNGRILSLHEELGIPIIHANDSHYIYPEDSVYRDIYMRGKDVYYEHEDKMILDYPDSDDIYKRYSEQGIVPDPLVTESLNSTLIFDECEKITLINDDIKLPEISEHPMDDLRKIVYSNWDEEKKSIAQELYPKYESAIEEELGVIEETNMANYFLIDNYVVKRAQDVYGGKLTKTGRGSGVSFYVNKLLGLTDIDRIASPITLFPSRFMSAERIINARSLPDIDLNVADQEPFIKATEDLLGAENCAWMLTWKPLQESSAFRLYCKGSGLHISEYDEIAKNLEEYKEEENWKKLDNKWKKLIKESERFIGVIESVSQSPCSMVLYYKNVSRELGLVRTPGGKICCLLDGYNCDKYKYLKNDYLCVIIWSIIRDVCESAGIEIPTIRELDELLDEDTFKIYDNGLTCTINQADSDFATGLVKEYKPRSVAEMSAFVAIIRPGCKSLLDGFIHREPYTTGVEALDAILEDSGHRLIYQESIMKYLIWLSIKEAGTYDIIKKIAKKKFKAPELEALKSTLKESWIKQVGTIEGFEETWIVIEQAAKYSFNASHSLSYAYDSLYGAYLKSHYPMDYYTVVFNYYDGDMARTRTLTNELKHFGIQLKSPKFRKSLSGYSCDKEGKVIYKGLHSIKFLNSEVADGLYSLRDNQYRNFIDFLYDAREKVKVDYRQLSILIQLDFFEEFGDANSLLVQLGLFKDIHDKKQLKKDKLLKTVIMKKENVNGETVEKTFDVEIPTDIAAEFCSKETEKQYSGVNMRMLLEKLCPAIEVPKATVKDKVNAQKEYLGYIDIMEDRYTGMAYVEDLNTKYTPRLELYSLKNGTILSCKISKPVFNKNKLEVGDVVLISSTDYKPKSRKLESGGYEEIPGTRELWITRYEKVAI